MSCPCRYIEPLLEAVVDGISDEASDVAFLAHQLLIQVVETGYVEAKGSFVCALVGAHDKYTLKGLW